VPTTTPCDTDTDAGYPAPTGGFDTSVAPLPTSGTAPPPATQTNANAGARTGPAAALAGLLGLVAAVALL
jgi:hypothetical protein